MTSINILQGIAVDARQTAKEQLKIVNLHDLRKLPKSKLAEFQMKTAQIVAEKISTNTQLEIKVVRMVINTDNVSYVVIVSGVLIDCALDYYIPTKTFAMPIAEYPLKIMEYQIVTDKFVRPSTNVKQPTAQPNTQV